MMIKKISKIVLAIIISFLLAASAAAAVLVKGRAPDLPPLQPAPQGVAPNYQNNINNISNPEVLPGQNGGSETSGAGNPAGQSSGLALGNANAASKGGAGSFISHNKTLILVWTLIVFIIGAGLYWRFGKKKDGENQ